jgi:hypothetical protein
MKAYVQKVKEAGIHNQTVYGNPDTATLRAHIARQMRDLVSDVVEQQVRDGAFDRLTLPELQLLTLRLPELSADDFQIVDAIVDAVIPPPSEDTITLRNRGVNIPE